MGGSCQDRPGLTPVCRATTFLIQPNVKSQPLDERLKWLTAPGRRIPGAVTWPGFVGSPAHQADGPPSGRCWERRTIDLGKSATDAGRVTAPDCTARLSLAPRQSNHLQLPA
jgi:hypothetical protein